MAVAGASTQAAVVVVASAVEEWGEAASDPVQSEAGVSAQPLSGAVVSVQPRSEAPASAQPLLAAAHFAAAPSLPSPAAVSAIGIITGTDFRSARRLELV